jgi:soluble cytochrome b562
VASLQATQIEAKTAKIEAQAAKIEALTSKIEAQAAKIEAQAVTISKLTETVTAQGLELADFRHGVTILITQLAEMNVEPRWQPRKRATGELKAKS